MKSKRFSKALPAAISAFAIFISLGLFRLVSAHEAYVLDSGYFWDEFQKPIRAYTFDALKNPKNLRVVFFVILGVTTLFILDFLFRRSSPGKKFHRTLERLASFGPIFVRAAISLSFFFSALTWSFLGPELPLGQMPFAGFIQILLFVVSILVALGLFVEVAAGIGLILFVVGFFSFGSYIFTYLNYIGVIIALLLFGARKWSFDGFLFGKSSRLERWKYYETVIIRLFFGIALAYTALTVKFFHPSLPLKVVNDWNLTQFGWLFPSDPLLVVLGAGIVELFVGLLIIFGLELRFTVFITLIYATLALFYFRELLWPHLMLYGISLSLLVQPETFTLDSFLLKEKKR